MKSRKRTGKGLMFTSDAVFAFLILATALPLILAYTSTQSELSTETIGIQAESAINSMANLRVSNVIREPVIYDLYKQNKITASDFNKTVLDMVVGMWASNSSENLTISRNITQELLGSMLENRGFAFSIEGDMLLDNGSIKKTSSAGRRVISGFMKGKESEGYVASMFLTSMSRLASSYYFFGGFVGQGNVTAKISVPSGANISELYLELNTGENFDLYINGVFCQSMNVTTNLSVDNWTITNQTCLGSVLISSENIFAVNFTGNNITNEYIGGGYIKLAYSTNQMLQENDNVVYYHFPGIKGIINLFDSFYVPGNVTSTNVNITFFTAANYSTILNIGNVTVINHTGTGQNVTINISNPVFQQILEAKNISYLDISSKTMPLRMFVSANISGGSLNGSTDVVLITDLSGSMNWRLDQDYISGNIINNCTNPVIYNSSTARISLAKCLDKSFVNAILGGNNSACVSTSVSGNRVALVGFNTAANNWESLTDNVSYLESRINSYTAGGGTCISCAINRASQILDAQSNENRSKYIVVMTDGESNYRSTPVCYDFNDVSLNLAVGENGASASREPPWMAYNGNDALNKVDVFNETLAKAVADGGEIYYWNGSWILDQDTGTNNIYGIDIFNNTFAFAVGSSAKIWKWGGTSWSQDQDLGTFNLWGVAFLNKSFAFSVGDSGRIYSWNSGSWSLYQDVGSATLYAVDIFNSTLAFAVGDSGKIYRWSGSSWSENMDTGSNTHYDIAIINGTKAFTASSNGRIYEWDGVTWTGVSLSSYRLKGVHAVNTTLAYGVGDGKGDIYEWDGGNWSRTYSPFYYEGNSTTGIWCWDDDSCSLSISGSYPSLNANYSAYSAFQSLGNITIDSVGFGPIGSCKLGNETVTEIAKTGNGTAHTSSNATQLQTIYCQIAENIITKATQTQQILPIGDLSSSVLYDSFIEFQYIPETPATAYQEISLSVETPVFEGCDGSFFLPSGIRVTNAARTSYSGVYWTKGMSLQNSGGARNVYNLSSYGSNFGLLGDPFKVYLPVSILAYNETNTARNELGLNSSVNNTCSQFDRVIYTARVRASVPYGNVFPKLEGEIVRVYYDLDHDGSSDGFADITIGGNLPVFNSTVRTTDQINGSENALDDALLRLLDRINFVTKENNTGISGSQTNPIDIKLSEVDVDTTGTGGIPFEWGPVDVRLDVKI